MRAWMSLLGRAARFGTPWLLARAAGPSTRGIAGVAATAAAAAAAATATATALADDSNPFTDQWHPVPRASSSPSGPAGGGPERRTSAWSWPDPSTFSFPPSERPKRLFDGHSFDGWSGKLGRYWEIKDGAIRAIMNPADAPAVSTYLFSSSTHRNFRLVLEMRMPVGNHSGIGFWGQRYSFGGEDYSWKGHLAILPQTGIFDIYNRGWKERVAREGTTDGVSGDWLCKGPGTGGDGPKDVFSLHGWNQVEILAVGSRIRIAINGVETSDWTDPDPSQIHTGPIALQQHWMAVGEVQECFFRGLIISDDPEQFLITTR